MFDFFKKRPDEKAEKLVAAANNVACAFSDLIASDGIAPTLIYDVSVLPHAKDFIEKCCKIWIAFCTDKSQLEGWKIVLPELSRFQEGVGCTPLGLDIGALGRPSDLTPEELAHRIVGMKQPSPELVKKVETEEYALRAWVEQAVNART